MRLDLEGIHALRGAQRGNARPRAEALDREQAALRGGGQAQARGGRVESRGESEIQVQGALRSVPVDHVELASDARADSGSDQAGGLLESLHRVGLIKSSWVDAV